LTQHARIRCQECSCKSWFQIIYCDFLQKKKEGAGVEFVTSSQNASQANVR
jgi:hypothetical protein